MRSLRLKQLVLMSLIIATLGLGACTRSASTPPASPAAGTGTPSSEDWQQQTMEAVRFMLLTQTAQAAGGAAATATATSAPAGAVTPQPTQATTLATTGTPIVIAATPTSGPRPSSYTLQEGEYPYCIARRFNVDPAELMSLNGIVGGTVVYPGTALRIPQTGNTFPPPRALRTHPVTYTVRSGDTIYNVACLFGDVDPIAIASRNSLAAPYTLTPGSVINIP